MAKHFPIAHPGDVWTAGEVNEIRRRLSRLDHVAVSGASAFHGAGGTLIHVDKFVPLLVELDEHVEPGDDGMSANVLRRNEDDDDWEDTDRDVETVADVQDGVYLDGERHVLLPHPSSGKRIVLPGVQWHLARTDEAIPAGGSGDVTVWEVVIAGEQATTITVTAYNFFGEDVPSATDVMIIQHLQSRRWYLIAADCP